MMKNVAKTVICAMVALLVMVLVLSAPAVADGQPALTIDSVTLVKPGESTTVALRLADLPSGIYMIQVALEYDADKLQLTATSPGDVFSTVGAATINDTIAGKIYLNWDSASAQISSDCVLLNMTFAALSQETCDSVVEVSASEECILANWEAQYVPRLLAGTVHIEKDWAIPKTMAANFEGKIGLNYYMWLPDYVINDPGSYALLVGDYSTQKQMVSTAYPATVNGEQLYVFSYYLVAYEIRDTICLKLFDGNGNPISIKNKRGTKDYTSSGAPYSLYSYCDYMKDYGSTAEMRALAVAALDYCTAAQLYFNYHVSEGLAVSSSVDNVQLSQMEQYKATLEGSMPNNTELDTITALFESDNSLRVYFTYLNNVDPSSYSYTLDDAPFTLRVGSGNYYVSVDNVPANHLGDMHYVSISDQQKTATVKCGVLTYARLIVKNGQTENSRKLGKALYLYNLAAYDFFGDR